MENKPPAGGGGGGRGRGRGRTLTAQEPPASPPAAAPGPAPAPVEVPHAERYEPVVQEPAPVAVVEPPPPATGLSETFGAMYVAPREGTFPGESERGRSRGRGAGRGRPDAGRGAAGPQPAYMEQVAGPQVRPPLDHGDKFADDPQLPGTPPEELPGTPPELPGTPPELAGAALERGSPESVVAEGVGDANGAATVQNASITSGRGSTLTTVVPELPVINRSGTKGVAVPMKTNYMRLKLKPKCRGVVEYHVTILPSVEDVRMRRQLLGTEQAKQVLGETKSFDGMILFLPHILDLDVTVFSTHLREDAETMFTIKVAFTKVRPMNDCIVFFNILLNRILRQLNYKEIRREFYDMDMAKTLDQHKLEIWPGTSLCTENQEDGLMICVDTTNRVLRQDTVLDCLNKLRGNPRGNTKAEFEEFIINKIVITKYNYKCYKIDEVAWDMQPNTTFVHRGKEVNFKDYLKRYPEAKVTDDKQPMLISKLKPRKNERVVEGEGERLAALVPECCYITGLTEDQKQNFKVMTDLAASTRIVPAQRVTNLDKFISRILGDETVKDILGNWGLCIERNVIEVIGRRHDGPNLLFSMDKNAKPTLKAGPDFSRESARGVYEPIATRKFVVLCTQRDADKAKAFLDCYKSVCNPLGINMLATGDIAPIRMMNPTDINNGLKQYCPKPDSVQFVVVIMPGARDDIYAAIKRYCVANVPIPSQCIVSKTLGNEKRLRSIVVKIAMQINCKLGGALWALQMPLKEDVMFIGIDAAHDPLKKDASVMCLVANLNNECTKYFSKSSISKVHQELADSLQLLTKDALHMYNKHRGKYPDRIVVFRDGGSMGAFEQMNDSEAKPMKKAAFETCGDTLQNFTFTVVTKRIPQRFFAKLGPNKIDNPQPGTIVDSVVTRRHHYDFYIVSQLVRQGTVNPTHFVILDADDQIRPDLIQRFAYVTCFQYFNWSGTVRVPAMIQYAHKLSALLIKHVKVAPHRDISTTLYYL